jgi:hypothetical protein
VKLEAKSLGDLAMQLRQKYPDAQYERTLHQKRDRDAEKRRENAMDELIKILGEAIVDRSLRETGPET